MSLLVPAVEKPSPEEHAAHIAKIESSLEIVVVGINGSSFSVFGMACVTASWSNVPRSMR